MAKYILDFTEKYNMTFPGWEPERMSKLDELFKAYAPVTKEKLWENLFYFLRAIMPTCEECDIKMAIHMDDPPWDIFGLRACLWTKNPVLNSLKRLIIPVTVLHCVQGRLMLIRLIIAPILSESIATESHLPIYAIFIILKTVILLKRLTVIAAAKREL